MHVRTAIHISLLTFVAIAGSACSGGAAAPAAKTEVLPADGGELGKAFAELTKALTAGDKATAGKLLDPDHWHMDNKEPDFLVELSKQAGAFGVIGGKRQGDRATLFLATKQPYYAMLDATHTAAGWQFDSPLPTGSSVNATGPDCAKAAHQFPCTVASAPDAQVSGNVTSHRKADPFTGPVKPVALLDGVAVRMLDSESKAVKSTKLILSGRGINPQMLALSFDPSEVQSWLNYPLLTLDVAPDGKSAKAEYFDGMAHKRFDLSDGLSIDAATPNRIKGQLKTDVADTAQFNLTFDIGTTSECFGAGYHCSAD